MAKCESKKLFYPFLGKNTVFFYNASGLKWNAEYVVKNKQATTWILKMNEADNQFRKK